MPLFNSPSTTGWNQITETFAYASATTITVATGAASRFQKDDKLQLTQHGAVKYFYIVAVADTLLTVACNGAVVIENTATYPITAISFSRIENPFGFPLYFAWTPVITAASGTPTTTTSSIKFSIKGGILTFAGSVGVTDKGTASSGLIVSLPVAAAVSTPGSAIETSLPGLICCANINAGNTIIWMTYYNNTTLWANGASVQFSISYFY